MMRFFIKYCFLFLSLPLCAQQTPYEKTLGVVEVLNEKDYEKAKNLAKDDAFLKAFAIWYEAMQVDENDPQALTIVSKAIAYAKPFPHKAHLEKKAEKIIVRKFEDDPKHPYVLKWFHQYNPHSYDALKLCVKALITHKQRREAKEVMRRYWHTLKLNSAQEVEVLGLYGPMLSENDIIAVIAEHIHRKRFKRSEQLMPFITKGHVVYFQTLQALYQLKSDALEKLAALPKRYHGRYGLLKALLYYHKRKDNSDAVIHLLKTTKLTGQNHKEMVSARKFIAREKIRVKDYKLAYKLAANHGFTQILEKSEFDWLAGFIALHFLQKPQDAYKKFANLYGEVSAPISKGRMAYWAGRASEALKHKKQAAQWYEKGRAYGATFYGQLSARKVGKRPDFSVMKPQALRGDFARYLKIAKAFKRFDNDYYAGMFLKYLAKKPMSAAEKVYLAHAAQNEFERLDVSAPLGRSVMGKTRQLVKEYYPTIDYPLYYDDPALVHAVILHESVFDARVISGADDSGLMQMIPKTARHVAKLFKVPYKQAWMTQKPEFNVKLGSLHLKELDGLTEGCYPLMAAAYNAGIEKTNYWVNTYGDPRKNEIGIVDWIELISYEGTRNYVQRVMEKIYMYRTLYPKFVKDNKGRGKVLTKWVLF